MPEARDGYFTTCYAFNKIILDIITVKFILKLKEENPEFYAHLENILVQMTEAPDIAIFKCKRDYVRNKQKLLEYMRYAQIWQVLSVICSYAAFICDNILVVTLIVFFIKYQKTMQAMLMAFITTNMSKFYK